MQITNGSVSRTYKPGDYEGRTVTLSFTIDPVDDPDGALTTVAALAEKHARRMPEPADLPNAAVPPTQPAAATTRSRKGQSSSSSGVSSGSDASSPTTLNTSAEPTSQEIAPSSTTEVVPPTSATAAPDMSAAPPTGASPTTVSDPRLMTKALQDACAAKVAAAAAKGDVEKSRVISATVALRQKFTNDPAKSVEAIPMDQRAAFLDQLAAI
jgi:hypothetical protein